MVKPIEVYPDKADMRTAASLPRVLLPNVGHRKLDAPKLRAPPALSLDTPQSTQVWVTSSRKRPGFRAFFAQCPLAVIAVSSNVETALAEQAGLPSRAATQRETPARTQTVLSPLQPCEPIVSLILPVASWKLVRHRHAGEKFCVLEPQFRRDTQP